MDNQNLTNQQKYELKKGARRQEEEMLKKRVVMRKWLMVGGILLAFLAIGFGVFKLASAPSSSFGPVGLEDILTVKSDDWTKGNNTAKATLIEYMDFECEACGAYYPMIKEIEKEFGDDLLVVTRYFPLPNHKNSMEAGLAAEAAGKQGKYWEMHNMLFESQKEWGEKPKADPNLFVVYAEKIGLNIDQFNKDRSDPSVKSRVERDKSEGMKLNLTGTPSFFLNGKKISSPQSLKAFSELIKKAMESGN